MADTQPMMPLIPDPLLGQRLNDFVVETPLAAGGMGVVYRARHPLIGRLAAIKVLKPEFAEDGAQTQRFLKEAQALSAIKHRGIVDIYGFGDLPDGRQYMVTEFLEGESLEAVNAREAPMPPLRVLGLLDEILHALSAAHRSGVVHRDLKPSNVFLAVQSTGERVVKLLDFGLAKQSPVTLANVAEGPLAKASLVAGTPEYIAPEQARGLAATPRTDLYCIGVMMFEMLSGTLPFKADTIVEMLKQHVYEPAPKLSGRVSNLPHELYDLVDQLLEKEPEKRPATAELVRHEVHRLTKRLQSEATMQRPNPLQVMPAPFRIAPPDAPTPKLDTRQFKTEPAFPTIIPDAKRVPTEPVLRTPTADKLERELQSERKLRPVLFLIALALGALIVLLAWPKRSVEVTGTPAPPKAPVAEVKPAETKPAEPAPKPAEEAAPVAPEPDHVDLVDVPLAKLPPPSAAKTVVTVKSPTPTVVSVDINPACAHLDTWMKDELDLADEIETRVRSNLKNKVSDDELEAQLATLKPLRAQIKAVSNGNECTQAGNALQQWAVAHTK